MKIGILNPLPQEVPTFQFGSREFEKAITSNLGNLMFRYAGSRLYPEMVPVNFQDVPQGLASRIDGLVYPTANILNSTAELGGHARFFQNFTIPFAVVGVGVQTQLENPMDVQVRPASRKFFEVLASKCSAVGVRGLTTGRILEETFGARCITVGCPSNLISTQSDSDLGSLLERKYGALKEGRKAPVRIALHPQHGNNYMNAKHEASEKFLYRLAVSSRGASYVCNGPLPVFSIARNRLRESEFAPDLKKLHQFLNPAVSHRDFINEFLGISFCFGSLFSWLEFLSAQDLVVGKRVHGCIAAMQCGVPAILIAHDTRTLELAETIGIPHVKLPFFEGGAASLETLLEAVEFSGADYARKRGSLRENLNAVCTLNGLPEIAL